MLEKDIEAKVVKWAKKNGWLSIKYTPMGVRGWPDRIFISPEGRHVWIEFKKPPNKPTELQQYRIDSLKKQRVLVAWFNDADDCIIYLGTFA